jgi:hypothetical protein
VVRQPEPDLSSQRRLRQRVLDALDDLACPLDPEGELSPFLEGVFGEPVLHPALQLLLKEDRKAFDLGSREMVLLCPAIDADLEADPRRWTRSDWPLWSRIVHPDSEIVRSYWLIRELYRTPILLENLERPPASLASLIERLAKRLPSSRVAEVQQRLRDMPDNDYDWNRDRFYIWNTVAEELYDEMADEDRMRCEEVAARLIRHSLAAQLFGIQVERP